MTKVVADFVVKYIRGGTEYIMEDRVVRNVPKDTPYFDIVAQIDEEIFGKFGIEAIIEKVSVRMYAISGKGEL